MSEKAIIQRVLELDAEFREMTGREAYNYCSRPTPTTERHVFADSTVKMSAQGALDYMAHLVLLARTSPELLPHPFDQELEPAQDRRSDMAWVRERLSTSWT